MNDYVLQTTLKDLRNIVEDIKAKRVVVELGVLLRLTDLIRYLEQGEDLDIYDNERFTAE